MAASGGLVMTGFKIRAESLFETRPERSPEVVAVKEILNKRSRLEFPQQTFKKTVRMTRAGQPIQAGEKIQPHHIFTVLTLEGNPAYALQRGGENELTGLSLQVQPFNTNKKIKKGLLIK